MKYVAKRLLDLEFCGDHSFVQNKSSQMWLNDHSLDKILRHFKANTHPGKHFDLFATFYGLFRATFKITVSIANFHIRPTSDYCILWVYCILQNLLQAPIATDLVKVQSFSHRVSYCLSLSPKNIIKWSNVFSTVYSLASNRKIYYVAQE